MRLHANIWWVLTQIKNDNTIYKIKEESEQIVQCMFFKQCIQLGGIENCDGQFCNKGSITFRKTGIRNIDSGQFAKATNHWDLSKFAFELKQYEDQLL